MRRKLPKEFRYLTNWTTPKILRIAVKEFGVLERKGKNDNETILSWAKEIGGWVGTYYIGDHIPWCGLFVGVCAKRAHFPFDQRVLSSLSWVNWGTEIDTNEAMLGDVLIFKRKGGGHVGFYVGEDLNYYYVLGGNQKDEVNIMRIEKSRLYAARRCKWRWRQPLGVKKVYLSADIAVSLNEQ